MNSQGVSVCMIVKNEESVLAQGLDSLGDIPDEIVIVDTGSIDNTRNIAQKYTDKVYDFEWIDDFSAARNYAQQFVSLSHTFCWDADFYLDKEHYKKLIQAKRTLLDYDLSYFTWNAEYINGVAKKQELRSFIYTSDNFYWIYPIHNQLRKHKSDFIPQAYRRFDIEIHHLKNPQEKTHRYTQTHRILQAHIRDNPTDIRSLIFYASSCRHFKQYSEAIDIYERILRVVHIQQEYFICSLIEQYMLCLILNNEYHKAWSVLEYYLTLYPQNKILQLWHADKLYQKQEYQNAFIWYSQSYQNPLTLKDFQKQENKNTSTLWIPMIDRERYQVHPGYMMALILSQEKQYKQALQVLNSVIFLSTKSHVIELYQWLKER